MSANTPNMQWSRRHGRGHGDRRTRPSDGLDALTRRTLVVANLLGELEAEIFQAPGFGSQFFCPGLVAAGVDVNQRDVAE